MQILRTGGVCCKSHPMAPGPRNPLFWYTGTGTLFAASSAGSHRTTSQRLTRLPRLLEDLWPKLLQYYLQGERHPPIPHPHPPRSQQRSSKVAHRGPSYVLQVPVWLSPALGPGTYIRLPSASCGPVLKPMT